MTPAELLASEKSARRPSRKALVFRGKMPRRCKVGVLRQELGLNGKDISEACGISQPTYFGVERGLNCSLATAFKIAEFFGLTVDELWVK